VKRTYNPAEVEILKVAGCTEEEIADLQGGNAPFKLIRRADSTLDDYRKRFNAAISRGEAMQTFVAIDTFQQFFRSEYAKNLNYLFSAIEVLKDRGILSDKEILEKHNARKAAIEKELAANSVPDSPQTGGAE
jgi:hypothetical protein